MYWPSNGRFQWQQSPSGGGTNLSLITNQEFADPTAWYHMVFSYDSTPATPSSTSIKMFVNGTQVTSFFDESYPAQDVVSQVCKPSVNFPICYYPSTAWYSGYYAQIMVVDGQALNADSFGEFDEDSPTIWKPIDISGINVGNLGCYLEFKDSANLGTDTSGIGNFTETALTALNQSTDTPTNNFATINPLDNYYAGVAISEGLLKMVTTSNYTYNTGTVGLSAGKWYFEFKSVVENQDMFGIAQAGPLSNVKLGGEADEYGYSAYSGKITEDAVQYTYGSTWTTGAVIGCYLDIDNNKLYFANDGVIQNSGTGYDIVDVSTTVNGQWFPSLGDNDTASGTYQINFGNPTWTLTSGNEDANGYGNFEYSPNDGGSASFDGSAKDFLAICTKNLGSDGG